MGFTPFECTFSKDRRNDPEIQLLEIRSRDGGSGKDPCAWVFVRREERYSYRPGTTEIEEASITVTYQGVNVLAGYRDRSGGSFVASYSRWDNCISLTGLNPRGRGGIMVLDGLRGLRLGTYIFNVIVGWAKQWPGAQVNSIGLAEVDGLRQTNRVRRNRFYEQFGLVFDYDDKEGRSGRSRPMPADDLHQVTTWEQNITVHRVHEHLGQVLQQNERYRSDLSSLKRAIRELSDRLDHQANHPVRTALRALWALHARTAVVTLVVLMFAAEFYWVGWR